MADKILKERHKTHGIFKNNANTSCFLKSIIMAELENSGVELTNVQQESLDLICTKISRIVNGDPNFIDHWEDISGYALLVVKDIT